MRLHNISYRHCLILDSTQTIKDIKITIKTNETKFVAFEWYCFQPSNTNHNIFSLANRFL